MKINNKIKNQIIKQNLNQSGAALVMALLILSLMMSSAVALARIILGEVKMTVNTTNSLGAFYAADSAIEKGLYYVKYTRRYGDSTPLNDLAGQTFNFNSGSQSFKYTEIATSTTDYISYDITTSSPAFVDIIDPAGDISTINWDAGGSGHYYVLNWVIDSCFPSHASDRLEITRYSFDSFFNSNIQKDIIICNCDYTDDTCDVDLSQYPLSNNNFYRLSFRPLDSTAKSIAFDVYNSTGIIDVPSQISITANGIYKNAKYPLKVTIPSLPALSNVFSYVIFSEESLIKN